MIRINLLPYRVARRQQQIMHHIGAFVAVVVLSALVVLGPHSMVTMELDDLKAETLRLQQANAELKKKIGKIENLATLRADVERKLKIVDELQEGRFRSLKSLNGIAETIPENVWLTSIDDRGDVISMDGFGESNQSVAAFMRKLDQSELFTDVRLGGISREEFDGLPVRHFSLSVSRAAPAAIAKKGGGN